MFRIIKWIYRMGFKHALLSIKADEAGGKYISGEYINGRIAELEKKYCRDLD